MQNLAVKNNTDNGDAFISQTKVADLCGVNQSSISRFIGTLAHSLKLNEINQLDDKSAFLCIAEYAESGVTRQAISKHVAAFGCQYILNEISQLDDKSAFLVVAHYAATQG